MDKDFLIIFIILLGFFSFFVLLIHNSVYPFPFQTSTKTDLGRITDFEIGESCGITTEFEVKYYVPYCSDLDTTKHLIREEWKVFGIFDNSRYRYEEVNKK